MPAKIYSDAALLAEELRAIQSNGTRVVLANGCFDLVHVGHVRYLQDAKQHGEVLVVAINSDRSVQMLKGPGRPVVPENERAEILAAFGVVDYVVVFDEDTVDGLLCMLRPTFHAKGQDYKAEDVPEFETSQSLGIKTIICGDPKDHSSRELIARTDVAREGAAMKGSDERGSI